MKRTPLLRSSPPRRRTRLRAVNLEALERAATEVAAVTTELAACCRELRRRRIDPRKWDA